MLQKKYGCKILEEYCCLVEYELKARNCSKVNEQQTNILLQNMFSTDWPLIIIQLFNYYDFIPFCHKSLLTNKTQSIKIS